MLDGYGDIWVGHGTEDITHNPNIVESTIEDIFSKSRNGITPENQISRV
ncbi:hypothetical protein ISS96_00955 [Candidatus Bathyarchaeota archaeon]|nr:hypothetical protein [Candidatus Bathyarchaeota archaeon]